MFKFVNEVGESFDLDYDGDIYAIDSSGIKIAKFTGNHPLTEFLDKLDEDIEQIECLPSEWDAWTILINSSENQATILQRAIASAWNCISMCEYIVRTIYLT